MSQESKNIVKAGRLLTFSAGEYSDYFIIGHFVVLKDITKEVLDQADSLIENKYHKGQFVFSENALIASLIRTGYLLQVDSQEIHLGYYGQKQIDFY